MAYVIVRGFPESTNEEFETIKAILLSKGVLINHILESTRVILCDMNRNLLQEVREMKNLYCVTEVVKEESKDEKKKRIIQERKEQELKELSAKLK
jgi:hypothetical protein